MIRPVLVLDCDGVLLDSNRMKTRLFESVLAEYESGAVASFIEYQKRSFGLTRKRLLEAFFSDHLCRAPRNGELEGLMWRFGEQCQRGYSAVAETEGTSEALPRLAQRFRIFVASGGLETELVAEVERRGWMPYFEDVFGAPRLKEEILATLIEKCGRDGMLFVGDSPVDARCASAAEIPFVFMSPYSATPAEIERMMADEGIPEIRSLGELCE